MSESPNHPAEPTAGECSARARVADFGERPAHACWYPQMGGYVGRAVVVITPPADFAGGDTDRCFDAYVWHDGDFPFSGKHPAEIHHCMPSQFVEFGEFVMELQGKPRESEDES